MGPVVTASWMVGEVTQGHTGNLPLAPAQGRDSVGEGPPGVQGKAGWENRTATAAPREGARAG